MADLVFAYRSNTIAAYYAPGGELPSTYDQFAGATTLTQIVAFDTASCIGGTALDLNGGTAGVGQYCIYPGIGNAPETMTSGFTFVYRMAIPTANDPTFNSSWFGLGGLSNSLWCNASIQQQATGQIFLAMRNEIGQTIFNSTIATSAGFTTTGNVFHDVTLQYAGTVTSNVQVFVNGVTLASVSPSRGYAGSIRYPMHVISFGTTQNQLGSEIYVNEALLFGGAISDASIASTFTGPGRTAFFSATVAQPINSTDPGVGAVQVGVSYTFKGQSLTGTYDLGTYTDPGAANVADGVNYIFNDLTITGTLSVPQANTGAADTVPINQVKEQIRYALAVNNTSTGAPTLDLSSNMRRRVQTVQKLNPEVIPLNNNAIPAVTVFTQSKTITPQGVMKNQLAGKRQAELNFSVVGMVYAPNWTANKKNDAADDEIEYLMENVERVLRAYDDLGGNVSWHFPNNVTYHSISWDEETHFRAGIMDLSVKLFY